MTPEERAALLRVRASGHDLAAARLRMAAAAVLAGEAIQRFHDAFTQAEAREFAEHPDVAEMNVMLDGFYTP